MSNSRSLKNFDSPKKKDSQEKDCQSSLFHLAWGNDNGSLQGVETEVSRNLCISAMVNCSMLLGGS